MNVNEVPSVVDSIHPALFVGAGGEARLWIVRYQFPEIRDRPYDADWLLIQGAVEIEGRHWEFVDPALMTWEVQDLADWLDELAGGREPRDPYVSFVEPAIQVVQKSSTHFRLAFAMECAPPWATRGSDRCEYGIDVPIGPGLHETAGKLHAQLARFPPRVPLTPP